jgi:threonine/homoserine/homoserine lactone efflux protein
MELSVPLHRMAALFAAMVLLAALPSASALTVSAIAARSGFRHGAFTTAGIVLGDLLFLLFAVFGLALLVQSLGPAFVLVNLAAGVYLLGLSAVLWRTRRRPAQPASQSPSPPASPLASFLAGLLITLGDQKAALFYLGFLPAFLPLTSLTPLDVAVVAAVVALAVGGVKLASARPCRGWCRRSLVGSTPAMLLVRGRTHGFPCLTPNGAEERGILKQENCCPFEAAAGRIRSWKAQKQEGSAAG